MNQSVVPNSFISRGIAFVISAITLIAAGCGHDVNVRLAPDLTESGTPSVTVHIIGVSKGDYDTWSTLNLNDYWNPASKNGNMREKTKEADSTIKIIQFGPDTPTTQKLSKDDPIWKRWKDNGAEYLIVVCDVPRQAADRPGAQDQRRRIFPITGDSTPQDIFLKVDHSGLSVVPR